MSAGKNTEKVTDYNLQDLINGCMEGNAKSQELLYMQCFSPMMKVCLRYQASTDHAAASYNSGMMKVFQQIHTFRKEGEFMGWVRRIMVNTCITALKQEAKFRHKELDSIPSEPALDPRVYEQLDGKQILKLIQQLSENLRLVFNLYVNEGYSHPEIAQQLNISEGTSKWYLHEARKELKKSLKAIYNHETYSNAI